MFEHLTGDFACLHESDLISPRDVIAQLDRSGKYPIAGWPIIRFDDLDVRFYDIWAFRDLKGTPFSARQVHGDAPFRVASFGSCWQAPVELLKGRKLEHDAVLELCQQWRREGVDLWVDPTVIVEQPISLWSPA